MCADGRLQTSLGINTVSIVSTVRRNGSRQGHFRDNNYRRGFGQPVLDWSGRRHCRGRY